MDAGKLSRLTRIDVGDKQSGMPSCLSYLVFSGGLRFDLHVEHLAAALDPDIYHLVGIEHDPDRYFLPGWLVNAVNLHDLVPRHKAGFFRGRTGGNHTDNSMGHDCRILMSPGKKGGEHNKGQQDIHRGTGDCDQKPLPARVTHELAWVACTLFHGVFASHLDITANRQNADAVVGVAPLETKKALAKAEAEHLNPYATKFGNGVMPKLVDKNEHP